ncbi:hypothetical protein [Salinimicrobium sp. HB62]|uniref:hypothetical protein n=1 Tax=Salinimicrobium sp. HB62 TaxID=3077781 RepID=UPI002D76DCBB|nr:hypothetical protein [Salinimicrobium sp. HB62]
MKRFQLRLVPVILSVFIFSLYSCNVYHTAPGTISEAVESQNRVKVVTKDNKSFELKGLYKEGNELVGIAGKNSDAVKILNGRSQEPDGQNVKIRFQKDEILAVYLKNRKASRLVNYGVPVIGAAGLITVTSSDFKPDVGY